MRRSAHLLVAQVAEREPPPRPVTDEERSLLGFVKRLIVECGVQRARPTRGSSVSIELKTQLLLHSSLYRIACDNEKGFELFYIFTQIANLMK